MKDLIDIEQGHAIIGVGEHDGAHFVGRRALQLGTITLERAAMPNQGAAMQAPEIEAKAASGGPIVIEPLGAVHFAQGRTGQELRPLPWATPKLEHDKLG